jgi:glycosyltransferase involved in cell wall biosynthesis
MGILRSRKHHVAYRLLADLPDAVFCVSDQVRQHCTTVDRVKPSKVCTVYNGLDVARWDVAKRHVHSGQRIITIGNIRRVKGHDSLIQAAAIVMKRFPQAKFMIVGEVLESDYFCDLNSLVLQLGLRDCFSFVSGVRDIRTCLSQSDIFVLPSRSEGFSNALVEAMAASLPVIATEVGGNPEAVKDGENGYLVAPDQPVLLANQILRLLKKPDEAQAMGIAGRQMVADRFSVESMMETTCNVYRRLLED